MTQSTSERVLIVGGGFAGLSAAARLAQSGLPVTLLEAAELGFDASTRNQGWLYSGAYFARQHPELARMCYESFQQTVKYCPECLEPDQRGMYYITSIAGTEHLEWKRAWETAGIPYSEAPRDQLERDFPGLDMSQVQQAFLLPDVAFRPQILLERLAGEARNAGAEIRTHTPVAELLREEDRVVGIRTGEGEEVRARAILLATGAWDWSASLLPASEVGGQPEYNRVSLKTHLVAIVPEVARQPLCVVDRDGFNHLPHAPASVFGTGRWKVTTHPADLSVVPAEIDFIWQEMRRFFPGLERDSRSEVREWAGTTAQMMHVEQVEPGAAPLPTLINHGLESPHYKNLWSIFPGRATLWAHLAELVRSSLLGEIETRSPFTTQPPWAHGPSSP